jgi:hypothetical protein
LALLNGAPATTPSGETYLQMAHDADQAPQVTLFGGERQIDFTLFKPRGHYTQSEQLQRYFQAMSWLAQIDFRLVEYDPYGNPTLNIEHLAAAALLRDAIDRADQRATWQTFDGLFSLLVGHSDNTTLPDLDRYRHSPLDEMEPAICFTPAYVTFSASRTRLCKPAWRVSTPAPIWSRRSAPRAG